MGHFKLSNNASMASVCSYARKCQRVINTNKIANFTQLSCSKFNLLFHITRLNDVESLLGSVQWASPFDFHTPHVEDFTNIIHRSVNFKLISSFDTSKENIYSFCDKPYPKITEQVCAFENSHSPYHTSKIFHRGCMDLNGLAKWVNLFEINPLLVEVFKSTPQWVYAMVYGLHLE